MVATSRHSSWLRYLLVIGVVFALWHYAVGPRVQERRERAALQTDPNSGAAVPPEVGGSPAIVRRALDPAALAAAKGAFEQAHPRVAGTATFMVTVDSDGVVTEAQRIDGTIDPVDAAAFAQLISAKRLYVGGAPGGMRTVFGPILFGRNP